jgi:glycosyltransferase involved in cell wall biosynthesis
MSHASSRRIRVAYLGGMTSGGAERQQLLLAAALPRDRFAIEFVVMGPATAQSDEARALGLPVHVLGPGREGRRGLVVSARVTAGLVRRYLRTARGRHYDIIDAWLFHASLLAGLTRPLVPRTVLVAGRRSLSDYKASLPWPLRILDRVATRATDVVVANSAAVADDVAQREGIPRDRVRVIRNAVLPAAPLAPPARDELRHRWGVPHGALLVGCVANPRPEKGLDVLSDALLARPLPDDVHVVVIGDGPGRGALEQASAAGGLSSRVHLVGRVPDARASYGAFDILVSPSRAEGLPNSVLEAAAAGRAIVATRAGGTAEILQDGRTGLLVAIEDPGALRDALDRVLGDDALRERLGAAAAADVTSRFGIDRLVAETIALYEGLVPPDGRR